MLEVGAWRALKSPRASLRLGFSQIQVEPWNLHSAARSLGAAEKLDRPEDTSGVQVSCLYAFFPCWAPPYREAPGLADPEATKSAKKAVPTPPRAVLPRDLSVPRESVTLRGATCVYTLYVPCFVQAFLLGRPGAVSGLLSDQGRKGLQVTAGARITELSSAECFSAAECFSVSDLYNTEFLLSSVVRGPASRCRCLRNGSSSPRIRLRQGRLGLIFMMRLAVRKKFYELDSRDVGEEPTPPPPPPPRPPRPPPLLRPRHLLRLRHLLRPRHLRGSILRRDRPPRRDGARSRAAKPALPP